VPPRVGRGGGKKKISFGSRAGEQVPGSTYCQTKHGGNKTGSCNTKGQRSGRTAEPKCSCRKALSVNGEGGDKWFALKRGEKGKKKGKKGGEWVKRSLTEGGCEKNFRRGILLPPSKSSPRSKEKTSGTLTIGEGEPIDRSDKRHHRTIGGGKKGRKLLMRLKNRGGQGLCKNHFVDAKGGDGNWEGGGREGELSGG